MDKCPIQGQSGGLWYSQYQNLQRVKHWHDMVGRSVSRLVSDPLLSPLRHKAGTVPRQQSRSFATF